jgi:hypothetical protein
MSDLVNVKKVGEPVLKIHTSALAQHERLGWKVTDEEPEAPKKDASKGQDKK